MEKSNFLNLIFYFFYFFFFRNYDSGYTHKKSYEEKRKKGRYHKKSNKYYGNDNLSKTFTNKNYDNKYNGDFINKNSNYAKKSINYKNNNNNNNSHYTIKKNIFFNSSKKEEEEDIKKPMFINSKLENNGNPDGNFIKLDQDFPKYNFIPNGEISDNKNNKNENENEKKNQNDNPVINHINLSMSLNFEKNLILDNNKSYNESQKHHYHYKNKHYDNNKGFNHNKNYKGNNFNLNQPSSRGFNNNNKFDNYNKSKNYYYDGGTKFKK